MFITRPITDQNKLLAEWTSSTPRFSNEIATIEQDLREIVAEAIKPKIDPYLKIRMERK